MLLRVRNCLILGAATAALAVVDGCWVDSSQTAAPGYTAAGASNVAGASGGDAPSNSAGASTAGTDSAGAAPTAGANTAGANTAGVNTAGAATGGGGAPAAGSANTAGANTAGANTAGGATGGGGAPAAGSANTAGANTAGAAPSGGAAGAGAFPPAGCADPTGTHQTVALDRSCWSATASDCSTTTDNNNPPVMALDGVLTTRFSTGQKMVDKVATGNFTYQVNLSSSVMIAGINVESTVATDAAPQLMVEVSTDGTTWKKVACGTGAATTDFSFAATAAQYVRLTQYGPGTGWWSIHEFNVYGSTGTEKACATAGGTPTGATCTTPHG